jgi:hypothetical protein
MEGMQLLSFCIMLVLSACGGGHHHKHKEEQPLIDYPPLYKWKGKIYESPPWILDVAVVDDPVPDLPPCDVYQRKTALERD